MKDSESQTQDYKKFTAWSLSHIYVIGGLSILPGLALFFLCETWIGYCLSLYVVFAFSLLTIWISSLRKTGRIIALILKFTEAIISGLVLYTQGNFELTYVVGNFDRSLLSVIQSFPWWSIILVGFTLLLFLFFYRKLLTFASFSFPKQWMIVPIVAILLLQFTPAEHVFSDQIFASAVEDTSNDDWQKLNFPLIDKSTKIPFKGSRENVMFLHLESLNSRVVNGQVEINGRSFITPMAPQFLKYAKRGLYFPEHYGNNMLTIFNEEAILCGIADNLDVFHVRRKKYDELFDYKCLPKIFGENGYKTYFFKSDDIEVFYTREYMQKIGFDITYNTEIMDIPKDRQWGYTDDIFYKGIFEYLETEPQTPKFMYIAMSTLNHYPFENYDEFYDLFEYKNPETFHERYANSLKQQDAKLDDFFRYYDEHLADNTHLFVFGDHSYPVGINESTWHHRNAYDDNFLTSMFYIPPKGTEIMPQVIKNKRYDHVRVFHTVLELMSDKYKSDKSIYEITPNTINQHSPYVRINQPYSDRILGIINYPNKWLYNFKNEMVMSFDLETDPYEKSPENIATNMSLEQFYEYVKNKEF